MGYKQRTSDYGSEPLIVMAEDGSRWFNVEDIEEMEWLMKEKQPILEKFSVKRSNTVQNEKIKASDESEIQLYPESEIPAPESEVTLIGTKSGYQTESNSSSSKGPEAYNVVNAIIDRLRTIKKRVTVKKSTHSTMYNRYSINRNKKPAVVKNSDGSKWFSVEDVHDVESIIGEKDLTKSQSCDTDVCVGSITKLQVVAQKLRNQKNKNSQYVKEKIVCVEYDVYTKEVEEPVKKMRAYLALQSSGPKPGEYGDYHSTPLETKNYTSAMKLTENEIKLIDAEIKEKKGYLDELRRFLRTDQIMKHDRAVSTKDLTISNEVVIHKRKVKDDLDHYVNKNIQAHKPKQKSFLTEKKSSINRTDIPPPQRSGSKQLFVKEILKPKSTSKVMSKPYLEANSKFDYARGLLQRSTQNDKYLQYMRHLQEMDNFNEKMTSMYVDVY